MKRALRRHVAAQETVRVVAQTRGALCNNGMIAPEESLRADWDGALLRNGARFGANRISFHVADDILEWSVGPLMRHPAARYLSED